MSDSQPGESVGEGVPAPGERLRRHALQVAGGRREARRGDAAVGGFLRGAARRVGGSDRLAAEARRARRNAAACRRYLRGLPLFARRKRTRPSTSTRTARPSGWREFTCAVPEHLKKLETPHVAHPGCFATATLLASVPLLALGLTSAHAVRQRRHRQHRLGPQAGRRHASPAAAQRPVLLQRALAPACAGDRRVRARRIGRRRRVRLRPALGPVCARHSRHRAGATENARGHGAADRPRCASSMRTRPFVRVDGQRAAREGRRCEQLRAPVRRGQRPHGRRDVRGRQSQQGRRRRRRAMDEPDVRAAGDRGSHGSGAGMDLTERAMTSPSQLVTPAAATTISRRCSRSIRSRSSPAEGVWLTNSRGERVLDLYGGHAVAALGYGHPGWTRRSPKQAQTCNFQTNAVPMQVRLRAAERLVRFSELDFTSVFFVNSGAEANENALKLAFRMTVAPAGRRDRRRFHGRTAGCGGGHLGRRSRSGTASRARRSMSASFRAATSPRSRSTSLTRPRPSSSSPCRAWRARSTSAAPYLAALRRRCDEVGARADLRRSAVRRRPHRPSVRREHVRRHAGHDHDGQGVGEWLSRARRCWPPPRCPRHCKLDLLGTTFGGGPMACAAIEAVHRGHRVGESARARAPRVGVHPQDMHRRPGHGAPGRGLPDGPAHDAAGEGDPGRAARVRHPGRHGQRSATSCVCCRRSSSRRSTSTCCARRSGGSACMKRFLDLADFERDEIVALLELARRLERHPEPQALAGKILGLVFFNPSLRTLASFQAGMARLGGSSFVITPGPGHVAAGDAARRRDERRRGRARARGHSGARFLLRCAGHPRIRRSARICAATWRRPLSRRWPSSSTSR